MMRQMMTECRVDTRHTGTHLTPHLTVVETTGIISTYINVTIILS